MLVMIMDLLFYGITLLSVELIYQHVDQIGPWDRNQFLFFIAFMLTIDHLHMALVSENFWNFSAQIRLGTLDFELLKPINTLFICFFRYVRLETIMITPAPWAALIYFGIQTELSLSSWILLPFLVIFSLVFLVSLEILMSMTMFITVESFALNFLRMQLQQLARWPYFIYQGLIRKLFTFLIPVLAVGSGPVFFLFNKNDFGLLIWGIVVTLLLWLAIGVSWRWALRRYESASS